MRIAADDALFTGVVFFKKTLRKVFGWRAGNYSNSFPAFGRHSAAGVNSPKANR